MQTFLLSLLWYQFRLIPSQRCDFSMIQSCTDDDVFLLQDPQHVDLIRNVALIPLSHDLLSHDFAIRHPRCLFHKCYAWLAHCNDIKKCDWNQRLRKSILRRTCYQQKSLTQQISRFQRFPDSKRQGNRSCLYSLGTRSFSKVKQIL